MRFRVGYGGPKQYRHGQHFSGGRVNNGNMTEIERFIHLIASMQILFGSRRGGAVIPLLIIGMLVGGWFLYRHNYSPERALEKAHQLWESNDTKQQISAIKTYKDLLAKSDPIEPNRHWLMKDRDTLYRRIIRHEFMFAENKTKAGEWIIKAWDEGCRDLRFQDESCREFWVQTTDTLRQKNKAKRRSEKSRSEDENPQDGKLNESPSLEGDAFLLRPLGFSFA
ncbi:MAG: hypothetical protein P8J27_04920 [Mariniblastus sp.]|nr:hypothetical protein [Mariniblastus sp.]